MSIYAMERVWRRYPVGGGEMLLALALADIAHDDGRLMVERSVTALATKTRQNERSVRRQLARMVETGWLEQVKAGGTARGQIAVYRISKAWLDGAELKPAAAQEAPHVEPSESAREGVEEPSGVISLPGQNVHLTECVSRTKCPPKEDRREGVKVDIRPGSYITRINTYPPAPQGGHSPSLTQQGAPIPPNRGTKVAFAEFVALAAEKGEKPIPEDDPVFAYCDTVGITQELLGLHWWEFKRQRAESTKRESGIDGWRAAFRKSVRACWYHLWVLRPGQAAELTTRGVQAQRERAAEQAAAEQAGLQFEAGAEVEHA